MCNPCKAALRILLFAGLSVNAIGQQVMSSYGGRYVFGQISDDAAHQYMLDTDTGRLWRLTNSNIHEAILVPVVYNFEVGKSWSLVPPSIEQEEEAIFAPPQQTEESEALLERIISDMIHGSVEGMIRDRLGQFYSYSDSLSLHEHLYDSLRFEFEMIR